MAQPDKLAVQPAHACDRAARILVVRQDETIALAQIQHAFPAPRHHVAWAPPGITAVERIRATHPDVVVLDTGPSDRAGMDVLRSILAIDACIPVIFVTSTGSCDDAIEAAKQGAFDYFRKPLEMPRFRRAMNEALTVAARGRLALVPAEAAEERAHEGFVGSSKAMLEVYKAIGLVSAREVAVLLTGESGTGKELAARAIHRHGPRAAMPFLALNCAAIPESLLESELLGHEKGSFTGAERRSIGKFEQVSGGTILLDEIGDMPLSVQAKILRVLQEQEFQRVGGSDVVRTDVRVIAATHRDLRALVAEQKFRADLYYRLAVCTVELPPLRDRADDLPALARYFVGQYSRELGRHVRSIAPETMARLSAHAWPGNIRELQSVLKQALLRASGTVLLPYVLPDLALPDAGHARPTSELELDAFIRCRLKPDADDLYDVIHREVDRLLFTRVLDYTNGNQRKAARILGIARQTVRQRLRALSISLTHGVANDPSSAITIPWRVFG